MLWLAQKYEGSAVRRANPVFIAKVVCRSNDLPEMPRHFNAIQDAPPVPNKSAAAHPGAAAGQEAATVAAASFLSLE